MNNKVFILAIISALLAMGGLSVYAYMDAKKNKKISAQSISDFVKMDSKLPDDFFKTILPEKKPDTQLLEPPPATKAEMALPPPPPVLLPPPEQIFNLVDKNPEPPVNKEEEERKKILRKALLTANIAYEIDDQDQQLKEQRRLKDYPDGKASMDKDFSEQKMKKEIPTYPVDLSRVLTANKFIPAVLITEINSEIPSEKVIAQVENDVVAFHGNRILIPKGSQAIGSYQGVESPDSLRMGIVWHRIITPDGINIKFTAEAGDGQGVAGMTGYVDARWKEKYGAALIFSSISALAQLTVPVNNDSAKAAADSFSKELSPVVAEQLRRALDKINRITIPKGERVNISPLTDIWFKEPKNNEIEAVPLKKEAVNGE